MKKPLEILKRIEKKRKQKTTNSKPLKNRILNYSEAKRMNKKYRAKRRSRKGSQMESKQFQIFIYFGA